MEGSGSCAPYPSHVSDEEWSLVIPCMTLMTEAAPQRRDLLRELFNGLRYVIRYGIGFILLPKRRIVERSFACTPSSQRL
jgi:transposase